MLKIPLTRRMFSGAMAALPLMRQAGASIPSTPHPESLYGKVPGEGGQFSNQVGVAPNRTRLMSDIAARRIALQHPEFKAILQDQAYHRCQQVSAVDPDIAVYRSFSDMAKITFQRQRNVENFMAEYLQDYDEQNSRMKPLWDFLEKLVFGGNQ